MPARTAVVATVLTCVIGLTIVTGETFIDKRRVDGEGKTKPPPMSSASKSDKKCMIK
jgi:hypothetical protein